MADWIEEFVSGYKLRGVTDQSIGVACPVCYKPLGKGNGTCSCGDESLWFGIDRETMFKALGFEDGPDWITKSPENEVG